MGCGMSSGGISASGGKFSIRLSRSRSVCSLPVEPASLTYGLLGMVVAWLVYDAITGLIAWPFRRRAG